MTPQPWRASLAMFEFYAFVCIRRVSGGVRGYFFRLESAWYISCPAPTIFISSLSYTPHASL